MQDYKYTPSVESEVSLEITDKVSAQMPPGHTRLLIHYSLTLIYICYVLYESGGDRSVGYRGPLMTSSLAFLALMLLLRAARLAADALIGFPNVEKLLYLEGYCAIG